jgi:hypothetical protein
MPANTSANKFARLLPLGLVLLSAGLILRNFAHGRYSDFSAGFLIGISIVFMLAGWMGQSRATRG